MSIKQKDYVKFGAAVLIGGVAGYFIAKRTSTQPATGPDFKGISPMVFDGKLPVPRVQYEITSGGIGKPDPQNTGIGPALSLARSTTETSTRGYLTGPLSQTTTQMFLRLNTARMADVLNAAFSHSAAAWGESDPNVIALRNAAISVYGNRQQAAWSAIAAMNNLGLGGFILDILTRLDTSFVSHEGGRAVYALKR